MDDPKLASVVGLLVNHLEAAFGAGLLPENTQIVIRPIFSWPDGEPSVWVILNTPN
jgi:hypothetical protein